MNLKHDVNTHPHYERNKPCRERDDIFNIYRLRLGHRYSKPFWLYLVSVTVSDREGDTCGKHAVDRDSDPPYVVPRAAHGQISKWLC